MNQTVEPPLLPTLWASFVRPFATYQGLATVNAAKVGATPVAMLGLGWSLFLTILWLGEHGPSHVLLPISLDSYYLVQALVMTPWLTGLWWLHSEITFRMAERLSTEIELPGMRAALGYAYAGPMLVLYLLPEVLAYGVGGFDSLAWMVRITLPAAFLGTWVANTIAVRAIVKCTWRQGLGVALPGLVVQALLGSIVIR